MVDKLIVICLSDLIEIRVHGYGELRGKRVPIIRNILIPISEQC